MSNKVIMRFGAQSRSQNNAPAAGKTNVTSVSASTTTLPAGSSATVAAALNDDSLQFAFGIPQGATGATGPQGVTGETGNGIASVELVSGTHAPGTTDTYRITFTNGGATDFEIYNGDDGATGNGIASVELVSGTHAPGTTDTYRITLTNGSTADFTVYNGADGAGAGDMTKAVYDRKTLGLDVYGYSDGMIGKTTVFNTDGSITETTPAWTKTTVFNTDGSITERITYNGGSWRQKTTVFNTDGSITETVTEGNA